MRQRLGIAQAIMEDPELLILDEPFNGLDKGGVAQMRKLIASLRDQGKTILLASHNQGDIDALCDTVCEMDAGVMTMVRSAPAPVPSPGPEQTPLTGELTVLENVALPLELRMGRRAARAQAEQLLCRAGLGALLRARPGQLSAQQRQLVLALQEKEAKAP